MDEGSGTSVDDSTSNNNDFTLTNGTWVGSGKVGSNAVRLDGSGDYISSDAAFAVGANVCTVSFWMYWTDSGADEKFIYELGNRWWQTDGSIALSWIVGESVFKAAMHDGSGNLEVKFPEPSSSQWVYVTVVYNGSANTNAGEIKLYYNGTSQSGTVATNTKNQASNIPSSSSTFFIGANSVNTQEITIDVDTFAVFSDELTQAEITWLYNSGNGKSYSDVSGGGSTGITLETSAYKLNQTGYSAPRNLTFTTPAVQANDILLLIVSSESTCQVGTANAGWNLIVNNQGASASVGAVFAYWKRATGAASETDETFGDSTTEFFNSRESTYSWCGAYSGCVTSGSPINAYGEADVGYSTEYDVDVTPTVANTMVVAAMTNGTNSGYTFSWDDGTTLVTGQHYYGSGFVSINEKLETSSGSAVTRGGSLSGPSGGPVIAVALSDTASTNNNFDFTVTTTTSSETFTIPCQNSGTFDATVDWGDGSTSAITAYNDADLAHIYATAGDHDISISGTFPNIYFNNGGDKDKVKSVTNLGSVGWTSFQRSFRGCSNMTSFDAGDCDTSSATSAREMFYNCTSLTSVDVSSFDTSSVTTMQYIFGFCSSITSLDLSNFDTSSVTLFANAFRSCTSLTSVDVSSFDTSSATNMISMFSSCSSLTTVTGIEDFDITGLAANQMTNFLNSSTLSTAVYDELLVNWEGQTGYNNQNPHFGSSTYTAGSAAATARAALVTAGWSITDGGTA
jgi:surface protein